MSSDEEKKLKSDSEEESSEEEEGTSEEEEEEEESEEDESSDNKTSSSASNKAPSATTSPRSPREGDAKPSPREGNGAASSKKAKEEKAPKEKKKSSGKKKKNEEQSVVVIDGRTVLKKTFELTKDKQIEFTVSIENKAYKPEEKVELKFDIKNASGKTMKSIKCVIETKGGKPEEGKDKKKPKKPKKGEVERGVPSGTEDEFYCGARFPLEKYSDFKGSDGYRLPKKIEKTSDQVKHELHLSFPIRSRPINSWKNIDAWLPIEIGN